MLLFSLERFLRWYLLDQLRHNKILHFPELWIVIIMQDLFMRFTLDSIFKIAFGYEIDTLKPGLPDIPFAQAFEITNEVTSSRFFNPLWKLQRAFNVGSEAAVVKSAKEVDDFIFSVIKARKAEMMSTKVDLHSTVRGFHLF